MQRPWGLVFTHFTLNHHLLFTYLAKLSVQAFGPGELALRLPSLAGGLLYALCCVALCRRLASNLSLRFAALGFLLLNPFVLDFCVAARGYGLCLGLLATGLLCALRALEASPAGDRRALAGCAVAWALGAAANLAAAPAVAGLTLALYLACGLRRARAGARAWARLAATFAVFHVLPAALLFGALAVGPLAAAWPVTVAFASASALRVVRSLVDACALHAVDPDAVAPGAAPVTAWVTGAGMAIVAGLLVWLLVRLAVDLLAAARGPPRGRSIWPRLFLSLGCFLGWCVMGLLHRFADLPVPHGRWSLHLLLPFTLAVVAACGRADGLSGRRARWMAAAMGIAALGFLAQLDTRFFRDWRYDAGSRAVAERILAQAPAVPGRPLRLAILETRHLPALRYYRRLLAPEAWAPVRRAWDGVDLDHDYFVLPSAAALEGLRSRLTLLHQHPVSGVVLAVRQDAGLPEAPAGR